MSIDLNTGTVITEEMVAKVMRYVGSESDIPNQHNTEATRDTIRHWAESVGDLNPLWVDLDYAAKSKFGRLVAPPSFLFTTTNQGPFYLGRPTGAPRGFPGVHRVWTGDEWEWYAPILRGDEIRGTSKFLSMVEKPSSFAKRVFEDVTEQSFFNQRDERIGRRRLTFISTERATAAKQGKHREFTKHRYTREEIQKIWDEIDQEQIRGAAPRYWEEVQVGDALTPVVKGPYTSTEAVAFVMGWGSPLIMAAEIAQRYIRAHPMANVPDRETYAPDFPERAHWDDGFAKECGFPAAYDYGAQRIAWLVHMLTNWQGDDGMLRRIDAKLVKFNVMGDTTWCRGKVTGKAVEDENHFIDIDVWGENQRGEVTVKGEARVQLPSRG